MCSKYYNTSRGVAILAYARARLQQSLTVTTHTKYSPFLLFVY